MAAGMGDADAAVGGGLLATLLADTAQGRHGLELNLSSGALSDEDAATLGAMIAEGRCVVDAIDLRGNGISLPALAGLCRALAQSLTQRPHTFGRPTPIWLEIGENPSFSPADAAEALVHNGPCCLAIRCSCLRCISGAPVHLRCRQHAGMWPRRNPSAAPAAVAAAPLLPAAESPLVAGMLASADVRSFPQAFAVCRHHGEDAAGARGLAVAAFEELEVLSAAPLLVLGTGCMQVRRIQPPYDVGFVPAWNLIGDPCDEQAFTILQKADDVDGLVIFVDKCIKRLGGSVMEPDKRYAFAASFRSGAPGAEHQRTFQGLLGALHNRTIRNGAGIRMPSDAYALREYMSMVAPAGEDKPAASVPIQNNFPRTPPAGTGVRPPSGAHAEEEC
eukprot:NODE_8377_length_1500_cov_3.429716.p1 GENE.NODE_8377_length_1500_cov_3.429716~~NODE_8377_length_1500_cov_3.429716.p1  ORF type:complete len:390 (-),score=94.09 NODE_8377_length_1500_cov_3.429716:213-1382(-)